MRQKHCSCFPSPRGFLSSFQPLCRRCVKALITKMRSIPAQPYSPSAVGRSLTMPGSVLSVLSCFPLVPRTANVARACACCTIALVPPASCHPRILVSFTPLISPSLASPQPSFVHSHIRYPLSFLPLAPSSPLQKCRRTCSWPRWPC